MRLLFAALACTLTSCVVQAERAAPQAETGARDSGGDAPCTEREWYFDADGDEYGTDAALVSECDQPAGYVQAAGDCDDADVAVNPGANEDCEPSTDRDCDGDGALGATDLLTWYADADGDGYGNAADVTQACTQAAGWVADATDCNDLDGNVHPGAAEYCDTSDSDCDDTTDDRDEVNALFWYFDGDQDGYGDATTSILACEPPADYVADDTDCDDTNGWIYPEADEVCDGVDDNCDGNGDAGAVDPTTFYLDVDGDGFGTAALTYSGCTTITGYVASAADCDDNNAATFPAAPDACDGVDHDCDGTIDEADSTDAATWYADADGDGYGDIASTTTACTLPSGYLAAATDCDDDDATISPVAPELCGGGDENCNGEIDEDSAADAVAWHPDADLDGYGSAIASYATCAVPSGYLADASDCDDADSGTSPAGTDACADGLDQDCDGDADDGCWPVGALELTDARTSIFGANTNQQLGYRIAAGGDATGDGVPDMVTLGVSTVYAGKDVYVLDAASAGSGNAPGSAVLATRTGLQPTYADVLAGDIDGDDVADLLAWDYSSGVFLEYGPIAGTSALVSDWRFAGYFWAVGLGDLTGDGLDDIVGTVGTGASGSYYTYVFEAATGTEDTGDAYAYFRQDLNVSTQYYHHVATGEDLDGDGTDDLAVGSEDGIVLAWSGPIARSGYDATDALVSITADATADPHLGAYALDLAPDLDGDGYGELVTSTSYQWVDGTLNGRVYVFPGTVAGDVDVSDARLWITADATLAVVGSYPDDTADVDGNGSHDLLVGVGSYGYVGGVGVFLSPLSTGALDGADADTVIDGGTGGPTFGAGTQNVGDLLGLGYDALAFGAFLDDAGATDGGAVYVYYGP